MSLEEKEALNINKLNKEYVKSSIKFGILSSFGTEVITLLSSLAGVLLLYVAGRAILRGDVSIGTYMAFSQYFGKLYAPVTLWSTSMLTFRPAFVALERIKDLMDWSVVAYPMRYEPLEPRAKNTYVSANWTSQQLEMVAKARRVIGFGGAFPPYKGLRTKILDANNFNSAFELRPINK